MAFSVLHFDTDRTPDDFPVYRDIPAKFTDLEAVPIG